MTEGEEFISQTVGDDNLNRNLAWSDRKMKGEREISNVMAQESCRLLFSKSFGFQFSLDVAFE